MKFPANPAIAAEARSYSVAAIGHTFNYDGWDGADKRMVHWITGKYCQLWFGEWCRLNGVPYRNDTSSPLIYDNGDLYVRGKNTDCKCSIVSGLEGQINNLKKDSETELYAFFSTDKNLSFVEPLGFASKRTALEKAVFVPHGELIPGTKIKQAFKDGSHFLGVDDMTTFEEALPWLLYGIGAGKSRVTRNIDYSKITADEDDIRLP